MLEDRLRYTKLFDLYGNVLTDKQRQCLDLYLYRDFSLSEIGEFMQISRQGVHDHLQRARKKLDELEEKLGLLLSAEAEHLDAQKGDKVDF